MEKRIELDRIPRSLRMKKIGSSANGNFYLTSNNRVFKKFKEGSIDEILIELLMDLRYKGFTFPEQLVIVRNILAGYTNRRRNGLLLEQPNLKEIRIMDFLRAEQDFEKGLREFSYDTRLELVDPRMFYTANKNLINVNSDMVREFNLAITDPGAENFRTYAASMEKLLFDGEYYSPKLNDLKRGCLQGYVEPSVFMSEALDRLDHYAEINTLEDYNEGLVLLRK